MTSGEGWQQGRNSRGAVQGFDLPDGESVTTIPSKPVHPELAAGPPQEQTVSEP